MTVGLEPIDDLEQEQVEQHRPVSVEVGPARTSSATFQANHGEPFLFCVERDLDG